MLLSELFDYLRYGELSHLYMGGEDYDQVIAENVPKLVSHINLGLGALYKRFNIKKDSVFIEHKEGVDTYAIRSRYSVHNQDSSALVKYLMDIPDKRFQDDLIQILGIYNAEGEEFLINNNDEEHGVHLLQFDLIKFNQVIDGALFEIEYSAKHPKLEITTSLLPENVEIELPEMLLEPLVFFVTERVLSSMGGGNNFQEANHFLSKYELACQQIEIHGLLHKSGKSNERLHIGGWV